ncbi:aminoglycoside phosphotransferase family protein [Nocardia transvalensis]|uniref:aminoglycoside phosphotransferase family protein n=1 Tax=Nocardia transvalensis TaxID=37333 RepID=UPI00189443A3|nr:aminoglycoside phosphotransferase family protein [Nocardia transvalensis]MBF6332499.1 aminoglycoside phosphotransferase family protein [Nocardia transvalensis]
MTALTSSEAVLVKAAGVAGIDLDGREIIREGSHAIFRLAGDIVARVGKPGSRKDAEREVRISQWLNSSGIPTVEAVWSLPQPVVIDDRPVTWWRLIPDHRPATATELGSTLRALHALAPPTEPKLNGYDPFGDLRERLADSDVAGEADRAWLLARYDDLRHQYDELPNSLALCVVHGDAWQGNLVVPPSGVPTLLDLDKVSLGRPDWDLIQLAVDYADFNRISEPDYRSFVEAYGGYDVTTQPSFRVLADIQELRWVGFALGRAGASETAAQQAKHRIACLRGQIPRPWRWEAL